MRKSSFDEVSPEDLKAAQNFVVAVDQFIRTQITPERLDNAQTEEYLFLLLNLSEMMRIERFSFT